MKEETVFADILVPRNTPCGIISFMTRPYNPQKTFAVDKNYTPQDFKNMVSNSSYMEFVIEAESIRTGVSKEQLKQEMNQYLDEIGLDKKLHVIRWMGMAFLKICFMMKIRFFVNETKILKLKSMFGKYPVLYLPTHRSYADFCLLGYATYHYDIDLPAVAAGMDFYPMMLVGRWFRETSSFYMRRSLNGQPLYAATLRHYVRTLVIKNATPIEFFLEGTRSRSNKSLPPKYGIMSMSLLPLFSREVGDIIIVPVNISYDRLTEDLLFTYEHLGVPKPKESTEGLLKSLRILNDNYGDIYVNIGEPFSAREYIEKKYVRDDVTHKLEMIKPVDYQKMTLKQFHQVQNLSEYVISQQMDCTVTNISNLIALVLMQSLIKNQALSYDEVIQETEWLAHVLKSLGATVLIDDIEKSVKRVLLVQSQLMKLDKNKQLRLISSARIVVSDAVRKRMKGHILKAETMENAVPVIHLQLYVNPILHYLVPPALLCLIVDRGPTNKDQLTSDYNRVRKMLRHEFFHIYKDEEDKLNKAIEYCIQNKVLRMENGNYCNGEDERLRLLLRWAIWPALNTLLLCADVLIEKVKLEHREYLRAVQRLAECSEVHPYCLSLDSTATCISGLQLVAAMHRHKSDEGVVEYELVPEVMQECRQLIVSLMPRCKVPFDKSNSVILDQSNVISRL